jgi:hypothetical protein
MAHGLAEFRRAAGALEGVFYLEGALVYLHLYLYLHLYRDQATLRVAGERAQVEMVVEPQGHQEGRQVQSTGSLGVVGNGDTRAHRHP